MRKYWPKYHNFYNDGDDDLYLTGADDGLFRMSGPAPPFKKDVF